MNGVPLSHFEIGVIIGIKLCGKTNAQVEHELKKYNLRGSWQSVARYWDKWQQNPQEITEQIQREGRPNKLSNQDIQQLRDHVESQPKSSRKELQNSYSANPQQVSGQSLVRVLKISGFSQVVQKKAITVSQENMLRRVQWAKALLRSKKRAINNCIYTDETQIVFQNNQKTYKWIGPNSEEKDKKPIQSTQRWPKKCMIQGAISKNGALFFRQVEGSFNQENYISILNDFYSNQCLITNETHFQHDNARAHTGKKVEEYFKSKKNIELLNWASQSPDINPIEQVWSQLKWKVERKVEEFENFEDFIKYVQQTFLSDKDIQKTIKQCISNIPKRLHMIIEQKGQLIV